LSKTSCDLKWRKLVADPHELIENPVENPGFLSKTQVFDCTEKWNAGLTKQTGLKSTASE